MYTHGMDKTLLTGAASGLGRACALALAARAPGRPLVLTDIDADGLEQTAALIGSQKVETVVCDLGDDEALQTLCDRARDVDLLINNAGVACVGRFEASSDADWRWLLAVNLWAPIALSRAALPHMLERGRGHIVNIASLAGLLGVPTMTAYSTSKFGLVGFSEALRHETAGRGVDVTVVCPGYMRTNLAEHTRYRDDDDPIRSILRRAPRWYGVSAERAASIIADAIDAKEPQVTIGPEKLGWFLKRVSPRLTSSIIRTIQWVS